MNTEIIHTLLDTQRINETIFMLNSSVRDANTVEMRIEHLSDPYQAVAYPELCGILVMGNTPVECSLVHA